MPVIHSLLTSLLLAHLPIIFAAHHESPRRHSYRLSKPLIGDDGRVYVCSDENFFAFENNGTVSWTIHLDYKCHVDIAPVHGGPGKIYLVAENRILKINFEYTGVSEPSVELFFGPEPGHHAEAEIIGVSVSTLNSIIFINVKNRGLFAYRSHGKLVWSLGPMLYQFGYRQGCRKNLTDCYFTSAPTLDQCEASIYISNTEGELYCLSIRSHQFRWIQDLSSLDKVFTITPGNNGHLYVTVPTKSLVLALDVFSGNVLWQQSIGPLSKADSAPVVDSNGWVSVGSLDGFLYSLSPTGDFKKFSRKKAENAVVLADPFLDCSGYAVYFSQTEMEGKISHSTNEYTQVSAIRPKAVFFTMLVPATGSIYWSESYPALLSKSDLSRFVVDEEILLAFLAASKTGNPLQCRTTGQKLTASCSQARTKFVNIYTGNERATLLFLLFQSALLAVLAVVVRFCRIFWTKWKLHQGLGNFLDKRRNLQLKKKAFDRTITELAQKAVAEATGNEVFGQLDDMMRQRENIERKLSTSYSLSRDRTHLHSNSLLPLHKQTTKSYSFRGAKKESLTMFHTLSDTSSMESSIEGESSLHEDMDVTTSAKSKGKALMEDGPSSDDDLSFGRDYNSLRFSALSSEGKEASEVKSFQDGIGESMQEERGGKWLKRRRALSSTD